MPINNIDAYRPKKETKGNGGDTYIPHHKNTVKGKIVSRLSDGCAKRSTCVNCKIPVDKCHGSPTSIS